MSLRLKLFLALLVGVALASFIALNPTGSSVTAGRSLAYDLPLAALLIGAFLGLGLAVIFGMVRDLGRIYRGFERGRRDRRADALEGISPRGVQAPFAGRTDEAGRAHGERTESLLAAAADLRRAGRADEALQMYRRVLARDRDHAIGLHGLRDVAAERGRWVEALEAQECLLRIASRDERAAEEAWLAGIQYEVGRGLLAGGEVHAAASRFRDALRARPDFLPAALALGDLHLRAGDTREAQRVWERALETQPAPPVLSRLEQLHRASGRPARMIALYRDAAARHPDDLAIAFGLGRVCFELAMLDEAAEQFQKLEVRAPELASVHAYLGAILERRGQVREAFEEYRRALRFPGGLEWLYHCEACGATQPSWFDRCSACHRWNTSRP